MIMYCLRKTLTRHTISLVEYNEVAYKKCCPLREIGMKQNEIPEKPWLSRRLVNACHRQNYLYRQFLKHRTITTENRYKIYKNKLTGILREEKINTIVYYYKKTKIILQVIGRYCEQSRETHIKHMFSQRS